MTPEEFYRTRLARSEARRAGKLPKVVKGGTRAARLKEAGPIPERCPICLLPFDTKSGARKPVWDHCHQGGHFRSWICSNCNTMLGFAADDPERLMRAAEYLRLDRVRTPLPPVLSDPSFKRKI